MNVRVNNHDRDLQAITDEALNFASAKFEFSYENSVLKMKAWFTKSLFRGASGVERRREFDRNFDKDELPKLIQYFSKLPKLKDRGFKDLSTKAGGWLFSIEDSIPWKDLPEDRQLHGALNPGNFDGEIYNFHFNDYTKEQLAASSVPVELLQGMTTIGVFRDGFRVRMSDDWLELAKSSTSGGYFQLRARNAIGYFALSNADNSKLIEKSDREGFVDNEHWRGFLRLARRIRKFANDSLESARDGYTAYQKPQTSKGSKDAPAQLPARLEHTHTSLNALWRKSNDAVQKMEDTKTKVLRLAKGKLDASHVTEFAAAFDQVSQQIAGIQKEVGEASNLARSSLQSASDIANENEVLIERNLRLLDAAAVGLSARALLHEVNTHMLQIDEGLSTLRKLNKKFANDHIAIAIQDISRATRELKKSVSSLDPLAAGSRSIKDVFGVRNAIEKFLKQRDGRLEQAGVKVQVLGGAGPEIRFSPARFTQILENLLQNSLYWISEHKKSGDDIEECIVIDIDKLGFTWHDGAKGVRKALEESLFDAYQTDKPEGSGQGLGLFIVTSFLNAERCSAYLAPERNKFSRRFKFRVDLSGAATQ